MARAIPINWRGVNPFIVQPTYPGDPITAGRAICLPELRPSPAGYPAAGREEITRPRRADAGTSWPTLLARWGALQRQSEGCPAGGPACVSEVAAVFDRDALTDG